MHSDEHSFISKCQFSHRNYVQTVITTSLPFSFILYCYCDTLYTTFNCQESTIHSCLRVLLYTHMPEYTRELSNTYSDFQCIAHNIKSLTNCN